MHTNFSITLSFDTASPNYNPHDNLSSDHNLTTYNSSHPHAGAGQDYYIYDYDYDLSVNSIPLADLVPTALVYGLTLVLGILGNSLVIFAIARNKRMQTVTNIFLVSLSSADLLIVVLCVPIKVR